jgi:hypothetical protein
MVGMYPSAVARQAEIESAIHEVERKLTPEVVRIRYEIGEDWSGQWAIFFRVVLTDDAARHRLRDVATKVVWGLAQQLDFPSYGRCSITRSCEMRRHSVSFSRTVTASTTIWHGTSSKPMSRTLLPLPSVRSLNGSIRSEDVARHHLLSMFGANR